MTAAIATTMQRISAIRATIGTVTQAPAPPPAEPRDAQAFSSMLAEQMARSTAVTKTPTTLYPMLTPAPAPAVTGGSGAPPGLEAYANGQIPLGALAPIPGGEFMWGPAAHAFTRMAGDAARAGITLPVVDAYRPYEDQVRLADELGLYSQGGLAAVPGTSQHGWGRAIDLELDDRALAWMRTNAAAYGFHETVPREPWHWEFHG